MFLAPRRPMMGIGHARRLLVLHDVARPPEPGGGRRPGRTASAAARPATGPALSPLVANLQAADALRESGVLTEEEFQNVKRKLLEA